MTIRFTTEISVKLFLYSSSSHCLHDLFISTDVYHSSYLLFFVIVRKVFFCFRFIKKYIFLYG